MRTAPQKMRNRSNANQANVIQSSPRTRVNRYIGRLIEARQTESDTADLNFLTLMYKCSEREHRVRETALRCCSIMLQFHILLFGYSLFLGFAIVQYHQVPDEYFTSAVVLSLILAALFGLVYLLIIPQYVPKMLLWVPSLSFFFSFFSFPLFYLSSCLFNIPKSVLLTPSFPSLLFSLSGAQWC